MFDIRMPRLGLSWRHAASTALLVLCTAAGGFAAYAWKPAMPTVAMAQEADVALIGRGAVLAAAGQCAQCHGADLSGGREIATPFGSVTSANITPDPETGIGLWSRAAFRRAMRRGVDRAGRHLYPACPYDHFTRIANADDDALYAYLASRPAVKAEATPGDLPFPLTIRAVVAAWKLVAFRPGAWRPDSSRDKAWNRGAYLVEGIGHCGSCHTPRDAIWAERRDAPLGGGISGGWAAYPLAANSPAPIPWTVDAIATWLGQGWAEHHGQASGPMAGVAASLAALPEADRLAIGTYLVDRMGVPSEARRKRARMLLDREEAAIERAMLHLPPEPPPKVDSPAAGLFDKRCAACHYGRTPLPDGGLDLAMSSALYAQTPTNLIRMILHGHETLAAGIAGSSLNDADVAALVAYLRETIAGRPAWPDVATTLAIARATASAVQRSGTQRR